MLNAGLYILFWQFWNWMLMYKKGVYMYLRLHGFAFANMVVQRATVTLRLRFLLESN